MLESRKLNRVLRGASSYNNIHHQVDSVREIEKIHKTHGNYKKTKGVEWDISSNPFRPIMLACTLYRCAPLAHIWDYGLLF